MESAVIGAVNSVVEGFEIQPVIIHILSSEFDGNLILHVRILRLFW